MSGPPAERGSDAERAGTPRLRRRDAADVWWWLGTTASVAALFVGLFTFVGALLLASTLAPDAPAAGKVFGSLLLGGAAAIAVFAVIISIRDATLPEPPPSPPPPPGKVEV
jgi:hypothetical protein